MKNNLRFFRFCSDSMVGQTSTIPSLRIQMFSAQVSIRPERCWHLLLARKTWDVRLCISPHCGGLSLWRKTNKAWRKHRESSRAWQEEAPSTAMEEPALQRRSASSLNWGLGTWRKQMKETVPQTGTWVLGHVLSVLWTNKHSFPKPQLPEAMRWSCSFQSAWSRAGCTRECKLTEQRNDLKQPLKHTNNADISVILQI